MRYAPRTVLLFASFLLIGCAGGHDLPYSEPTKPRSVSDILYPVETEPVALPDITPAWIASRTTSVLEVTIERTGNVAVLTPYSDRPDSDQGAVRIWRAADGSQIVLREGVLIATRGLGNDVESTLSRTMAALVTSRTASPGLHRLYVVTGENGTEAIDLSCEAGVLGEETIEIVGRKIATLHLRADCRHDAGVESYDFWVDRHSAVVWQSRQWAGPALGHISTRLLKE